MRATRRHPPGRRQVATRARRRRAIRLALPVRQPFDAAGVFGWLAARAVPGVELAGPRSYARTLLLPGGPATFEVEPDGERLRLTRDCPPSATCRR